MVEESVINGSPVEEVRNIFSNDDYDDQSQHFEWVNDYKAKNNVQQSFQNENVGQSCLVFIAGDKILKKLVRNKTNYDTICPPGPDKEKFWSNLGHIQT